MTITEMVSEEELEILTVYDPFPDNRTSIRIRRGGSWYNISVIDMNENPLHNYTIICVHGWGSNALNYRYLLKFLSPYFRVIAFDFKGHGESDKEDDTYDIGQFTEELAQLIDYYNPKNFTLVGHSMGTAIVMNYLYLNPLRANAAILLSGAANFREPLPRFVPLILTNMDDRVKNLVVELAVGILSSSKMPKDIQKVLREQLKKTPYHVYRSALLNTIFAWKKDEDLKKISTPTLIMVGGKDILTPQKNSEKLNELLPNSRLIIIPEINHALLLEQGMEVSNLIREFVEYQIDLDKAEREFGVQRLSDLFSEG
ncbi:MAG: alpha/beta hydrolase [Asgard group archaeon]|nr:alpha/beta hydrolase [Asgard group archaeon]